MRKAWGTTPAGASPAGYDLICYEGGEKETSTARLSPPCAHASTPPCPGSPRGEAPAPCLCVAHLSWRCLLYLFIYRVGSLVMERVHRKKTTTFPSHSGHSSDRWSSDPGGAPARAPDPGARNEPARRGRSCGPMGRNGASPLQPTRARSRGTQGSAPRDLGN